MAPGPSVVFTEFGSRTDPILRGWADFRAAVLRSEPVSIARADAPSAAKRPPAHPQRSNASSGIWRLIASNNREVARSLHLYGSFAQAREHVLDLQRDADALEIRVVKGPVAGQHGWLASFRDVAVISCGRWYSASSLSRESAEFSLSALSSAIVPATSRPSHPVGGYTPRAARTPDGVATW